MQMIFAGPIILLFAGAVWAAWLENVLDLPSGSLPPSIGF
jgi:hypothetical protein